MLPSHVFKINIVGYTAYMTFRMESCIQIIPANLEIPLVVDGPSSAGGNEITSIKRFSVSDVQKAISNRVLDNLETYSVKLLRSVIRSKNSEESE